MKPLWLMYKNNLSQGDMVGIIFKNGDGEAPNHDFINNNHRKSASVVSKESHCISLLFMYVYKRGVA